MAYMGNRAKIALGEFGLMTDIAPDKGPPNALISSRNISYFNGTIQKAPGTVLWNAVALPAPIVAIHDWNPSLVTRRMIAVTSTGSIYKGQDRQFPSTPIATDLGALTPNCVFAEGGNEVANNPRKLFLFTGGATLPRVLTDDNSIFDEIELPSPDWIATNRPKFGLIHRNRLWAFAGQVAYASDSGNHENFQTNFLADGVYVGEGGDLRAAFVYKGKLFAFKEGGFVYILDDSNADETLWSWQKISSNSGISAPNGAAEVLDNMYAGNDTGTITDYAATNSLGSVESGDLIQNAMFESHLRGNTSKVGVPEQHLLYYAEKKILFATYRSAYYTSNDMLLMLDFGRPQTVRASYWIKGTPQCLSDYKDVNNITRPMYGDASGFIHLMDMEDRKEGATAYRGEFQTAHTDFAYLDPKMSAVEKQFDHLAVHYIPEGDGKLFCDYYIDGKYVDTVSFVMVQNQSAKLNKFVLNQSRMAQANTETCTRPLAGTGRTFSARFYNDGLNESFQITAMTVYFRGGGDKAQQERS